MRAYWRVCPVVGDGYPSASRSPLQLAIPSLHPRVVVTLVVSPRVFLRVSRSPQTVASRPLHSSIPKLSETLGRKRERERERDMRGPSLRGATLRLPTSLPNPPRWYPCPQLPRTPHRSALTFLLLRPSPLSFLSFFSFLTPFSFPGLTSSTSGASSLPLPLPPSPGVGLRLLAVLSARPTRGTPVPPPAPAPASTPCRGMPVPTPSSSSWSTPSSLSSSSRTPRPGAGAGEADESESEPESLSLSRVRLRLVLALCCACAWVVRTLVLTRVASAEEGRCALRAARASGEKGSDRREPVQERRELVVVRLWRRGGRG